ncbi:MAG: diguanylate cyclase [Oscillospiraceae bacterium]|jgi:diguanylate cyclase (GGDEF)-like protein|nr:diguanylate cyclase [Oscillospiraceae bacterium]
MDQSTALVLLIVDILSSIMGFTALMVSLINPGFRRLRFASAISLSVFMMTVARIYTLTATTTEEMVVAYKIAYWGIPFIGVTTCFFLLEYCGLKIFKSWQYITFFAVSLLVAIAVQFYPHLKLVHTEIGIREGTLPTGYSVPGSLYYFVQLYNLVFFALGVALATSNIRRVIGTRSAALMLAFSLLPIAAHALKILKIVPFLPVWDALPAGVNVALFAWFAHITIHKHREWIAIGRELAVQGMCEGYILVGNNGELLDANDGAYGCFPGLSNVRLGTLIKDSAAIPPEVLNPDVSRICVHFDGAADRFFKLTRTPVTSNGKPIATGILVVDNTENEQLIEQLRKLSRTDPLTGLDNRTAFFADVERGYALVQRNFEPGAMIMMDIDFFKTVNDNHGHAAGDWVLRDIADLLKQRLRATDIVARYGGEEFCAWLPNAEPQGAFEVAEAIRQVVAEHEFRISDTTVLTVTLSLGVAAFARGHTEDLDDLLKLADDNLYRAKRAGRNRVVISELSDDDDTRVQHNIHGIR